MHDPDSRAVEIDDELRPYIQRAFDFDEPPESFDELWRRMMDTFAGGLDRGVSLDDLCTTDDSPHRAIAGDETYHYRCVTDALILGVYLDEPVTARTVSPMNEDEILVEFDAEGVVSAPGDAYLSFGVERSVTSPEGDITPETMYGRFCPYSEAFASYEEYEAWAESNPGVVSDALPLDRMVGLLARLLGAPPAIEDGDPPEERSAGGCSCR